MVLDLNTGKSRMLFKDARIGDLAFDRHDRSLWGLRHLNGYVTLVRIDYPYTSGTRCIPGPMGKYLLNWMSPQMAP